MIRSFFGEHRFLSNFWPVNIAFEGLVYPTVEHAYQASKTDDRQLRSRIINCASAGQAKKLGRTFHITEDWHRKRVVIMKDLIRQKFFGDKFCRESLIKTGDEHLFEGNNWGDEFWGVYRGKGSNHLGLIIMDIRFELQGKK